MINTNNHLICSALRTSHSALRTPHSTLRTSHFALHTPHFALRTSHSSLRTSHFALRTPHSALRTDFLHSTLISCTQKQTPEALAPGVHISTRSAIACPNSLPTHQNPQYQYPEYKVWSHTCVPTPFFSQSLQCDEPHFEWHPHL